MRFSKSEIISLVVKFLDDNFSHEKCKICQISCFTMQLNENLKGVKKTVEINFQMQSKIPPAVFRLKIQKRTQTLQNGPQN